MSADAKLKAYIDRILRCREAEDAAKDDTKSVYAELAGDGYEKAIVGQVVTFLRKREKDGDKLSEQSAKFDLYLEAYERPSHAHTREDRSDAGLNIVTKHEDIQVSPEAAKEQRVNVHSQHEGANAQATVQNECVTVVGTESGTVAISEKATVATQGEATEATSDEREGCAAANVGGDDVDRNALRVPTSNTGEGAAKTALPAKSRLRPNCQRPGETCGGYGDKHCHDCLRSMREKEAA